MADELVQPVAGREHVGPANEPALPIVQGNPLEPDVPDDAAPNPADRERERQPLARRANQSARDPTPARRRLQPYRQRRDEQDGEDGERAQGHADKAYRRSRPSPHM